MSIKSSRHITQHKVTANLANVPELRESYQEFLLALGLSDAEKNAWALCFTEAVNNSIEHGSKDADDCIRVRWWSDDRSVWLEIQDSGTGPDPENLKHPAELPEDPLSESGRGRYIIESFADKVEHWKGDRGYVMQMHKHYPHLNSVIPQNSEMEAILDELSDSYESLSLYDRMAENLLQEERIDSFVQSGLELFMDSRDYDGISIHVRERDTEEEFRWISEIEHHGNFGEFIQENWEILEEKESITWTRENKLCPFTGSIETLYTGTCVPVFIDEKAVALIAVAYDTAAEIRSDDIRNLRALADIIGISISRALIERERDQKKRLEVEINVATKLQHQLLPLNDTPSKIPGYELFYRTTSALEVAGDYVEVRKNASGEYLGCVIDVMGKGVSAAILAGIFRSQFIAHSLKSLNTLSTFLERCNESLKIQLGDATMFITASIFRLNPVTHQFRYCAAGHPPILYFPKNKPPEQLKSVAPPIGLFESIEYEESSIQLEPGDRIAIVTDGLYEWTDGEKMFGWEEMVAWFEGHRDSPAKRVWDQMKQKMTTVREQTNLLQEDDETLLILTRSQI